MQEIKIAREDLGGDQGRYVAHIAGIEGEAQIIFTRRADDLISADHTIAPPSMRGTGAAAALVDHMIGDARSRGFKIIPICPYVRAQYVKHPEWRDVMTVAPGEQPAHQS